MTEPTTIETRHLRAGWAGLALFALLGLVLEGLHAFKVPAYLDVGSETTRMLLRLGHAHGTLLSLVNVAFALTVRARPKVSRGATSALLLGAWALLPCGFLLGAIGARGGDPGLGVALVPVGALALVLAAGLVVKDL